MTLKQLSILVDRRYQYLIKILNQPTAGEVYIAGQWNIRALKKSLHKWYDDEEFIKIAGCSIDDLELEKTTRSAATQRDYVNVEDLEIGSKYIIRNYHYETECTLSQIVGNVLLFIDGKNKIKAIDKTTLGEHTKFVAVEDEDEDE